MSSPRVGSPRVGVSASCPVTSCGMSAHICSLTRGKWLRIWVDVLIIRLPIFVAHGLKIQATFARIYSPCATDTGKQGELDLCRYLHIGIGVANVGHFAYKTFRLLDTSPTTWTFRLLDISPTEQFAYETFRLLDSSPTPWTVRPLNVNTREWGRGLGPHLTQTRLG